MSNTRKPSNRAAFYGLLAAASAVIMALPTPASAVVYGGLEGLRVSSDPDIQTVTTQLGPINSLVYDDPMAAIRVLGGYSFNDYVSLEAGYSNVGVFSSIVGANKLDVDMKAWDVTAVGHLPLGSVLGQKIGAFVSAGAYNWDVAKSLRQGGSFTRTKTDGTDLVWGGGVQVELFNLVLIRLVIEQIETDAADAGVENITLGGVTIGFDL